MTERCRNQGAPFPQQQCGFHHEGWCDVQVLQGGDRRYQAECPNCGWHTREAEWRHWARVMADRHEVTCPVMQAHTFTVPDTCDETWWWDGNTHVCGRKRGHVTDHKCEDCGKKWGGEQ